jgi:ATP-dependent DNA ligase
MLARPGEPFDSPEHLFEIKWDGTRVLAFVEKGDYRLVNRHRADVTDRYPKFGFLNDLPAGIVLDGEVVVLRQGKPDFRLLLCRNQARASLKIQSLARTFPATYVVFDLIYDRFESLLALRLWARRQRLEAVVWACANPRLVFSEGIVGSGRAFFEAVCREGLEGVVAKRLDGRYRPGRRDWIKIKPRSGFPRRHDLLSRLPSSNPLRAPE